MADIPMTKENTVKLISAVLSSILRCSDCIQIIGMKCNGNLTGCRDRLEEFVGKLADMVCECPTVVEATE